MAPRAGELVTETFAYDGGRAVTVYVPAAPPEVIVFAADGGWHLERLVAAVEAAGDEAPVTMLVGVHGMDTDEGRLHEYVPGFAAERFAAHERFFVDEVGAWVRSRFGSTVGPERTAIWGASLGGECALALGIRHPDLFGAVLCASPGAGYRPSDDLDPTTLPRGYFVAGDEEPFFAENAERWRQALEQAGVDVTMRVRPGDHGGTFWFDELPRMLAWVVG